MELNSKVYVAGHTGLVGSAIVRKLNSLGYHNIVTATHSELDLTNSHAVNIFLDRTKPEYIFIAAAKVGGIFANNNEPVNFFVDNMKINMNVMSGAMWYANAKKVLVLGSSCIYPRECKTPIKEEYLMSGPLEPTNNGYAMAKIASIELCKCYRKQYGKDYISVMPCNLYGTIGENFNLNTAHVLPAFIRRFYDAVVNNWMSITLWGTGAPKREFMHAEDCAEACILAMNNYSDDAHLNIGCGEERSIKELAELVAERAGFGGCIYWDTSKPDGVMSKVLDTTRMKQALNWMPKINLKYGISDTFKWFVNNKDKLQRGGRKWSFANVSN